MPEIKLSSEQTERVVELIQDYFKDNLDSEIGRFDAEFLLDFFQKQIGCYFYNQALADSHKLLHTRLEELSDTLLDLQQWTPSDR